MGNVFEWGRDFKLLFNGERQGSTLHPPRTFCKRFLDLQKLSKNIDMPSDLIVGSIGETPWGPFPIGVFDS
jgi:hypothetical protein